MDQIFYDIFDKLPRVGPGNNESTRKAFEIIQSAKKLPPNTQLLDVGCGTGIHTAQLAKLIDGKITALDNHQAFMDRLQRHAQEQGVTHKIDSILGDMCAMNFAEESFDVIWAEGSIFIIGVEKGLKEFRKFLKPGGIMAFTEAAWFRPDPPLEIRKFWDQVYPHISYREDVLKIAREAGYRDVADFQLPDNAWWDEYCYPLQEVLNRFKDPNKENAEALAVIDSHQWEIDMYRKYSENYGYIFYILEKED